MPETVSQPADDLRSTLAAAFAEHETPAEPAPKTETPAAAVSTETEQGQTAPAADEKGRARGPDGKFVSATTGEPKTETEVEPAVDGEVPPESEPKPEVVEPPSNWSAKDKEIFKAQAPESQKFLLDRVKSMEGDYTKKTEAIAALKREYEPVDKMFEPYREVMRQKGFTPRSLIEAWANVEKRLAENPVEVVKGLVTGYRINPEHLANVLGVRGAAAAPVPSEDGTVAPVAPPVQLPPELIAELNQLRQAVGGLTQQQQQAQQADRTARETRAQSEIDQFKSAKDDKGNLLHPHFDEIEEHMTRFALTAKATQQPVPSLKDLYENAVWANPSTREKLRTAEKQQAEEQRKVEARAKAAAAKKASSSVTGAPSPGQSPTPGARAEKSLREELEDAAADVMAAG